MADKETVWYVREGRMCSGWIIASLNFEYKIVDGVNGADDPRYLGYFMKGNGDTTKSIPPGLIEMAERPGVWHLISGMQIVHTDDVFMSRESAAQAEFERLLEGNK